MRTLPSLFIGLLFAACPARAQQLVYAPPASPVTTIPASPQPTAAPYSNGTEISSRELAARQQRYFVFTTGNGGDFTKGGLPVAAGSYLNAYICNISGGSSGITAATAYITERIFDSSGTVAVPYGGVVSPAALTTAMTSGTAAATTYGSNIVIGGAPSPALRMIFGVGTAHIDNVTSNAIPSGVGYVYPGMKNELHELRILPPQTCFGQYVDGLPTALGAATYYLQFRFYGYME